MQVYISELMDLFTWTCSRCDGLTKGFEVVELIVDVQNCLQVYISELMDLFTWTCSRCDGLTKGFEVVELIVDVQNCLQHMVRLGNYKSGKNLQAIWSPDAKLNDILEEANIQSVSCNYFSTYEREGPLFRQGF
ncbi:hypothetical protein QVD17_12041 [Tagetes erecta]|uniref:Uncharacterized protein n=1 Tax=Tagetes erecta TaxID=13708 RepID=A0AAD8KVB1_TARER|nr:hypothetical protein QVD17_12041 [Tagetes erecta]